jgi:hypothetical protein
MPLPRQLSFLPSSAICFLCCTPRNQHFHDSSVFSYESSRMPKADSPGAFQALKETALFRPLKLGRITLEHRIFQAPLTRMRSTKESDGVTVPNDLNAEYYSQRASKGGFQLTEATDIAKFVSHQ